MTKWVEVAKRTSEVRFNTLSQFLNNNGIENEVEFIQCEPLDFTKIIKEVSEKYDIIRIGSPFGSLVVNEFDIQSVEMRNLKAADSLIKKDNHWVLDSANHQGLCRIVNEIGGKLDLESSVLVVGAGAGARVACSAFIKAGFKKVNITNKFVEQARELIDELKRIYFNVEFEFIPEERLVLLPGTNNICVNTTPLNPANDLLNELYYFNFLKSPGIILDFTFVPIDTPLITEAEAIGIKTVRGFEVSSWGDMAWVEWAFGKSLKRQEYCDLLHEEVKKIEFDMTPYQKDKEN